MLQWLAFVCTCRVGVISSQQFSGCDSHGWVPIPCPFDQGQVIWKAAFKRIPTGNPDSFHEYYNVTSPQSTTWTLYSWIRMSWSDRTSNGFVVPTGKEKSLHKAADFLPVVCAKIVWLNFTGKCCSNNREVNCYKLVIETYTCITS